MRRGGTVRRRKEKRGEERSNACTCNKSFYLSSCNHLLAEGPEQKMPAGQEPARIQACESH